MDNVTADNENLRLPQDLDEEKGDHDSSNLIPLDSEAVDDNKYNEDGLFELLVLPVLGI